MRIYLETSRLTLRRFTADDEDHLYELDSDPAVMRFINGGRPTPRAEIRGQRIPSFLHHYQGPGEFGYWAAEAALSGEFLGWFHLQRAEPGQRGGPSSATGCAGRPGGRGYATEGCRALIRKSFTELGVRRVTAQRMTVNAASRRVLGKSGMTFVRTINPGFTRNIPGPEHGDAEYAITRTEWTHGHRMRGNTVRLDGRQDRSVSVQNPGRPAGTRPDGGRDGCRQRSCGPGCARTPGSPCPSWTRGPWAVAMGAPGILT